MKVVEKKLVDETPEETEGARRATGVFSGEEASAHAPVGRRSGHRGGGEGAAAAVYRRVQAPDRA